MTSTISDTDLLDLSTDLFDEDIHTQDEEASTKKEQCAPKTDKDLKTRFNASTYRKYKPNMENIKNRKNSSRHYTL